VVGLSRTHSIIGLSAAFIFLIVAFVPAAPAQAAAPLPQVLDLYLADGALSPAKPTASASLSRSINNEVGATTPGFNAATSPAEAGGRNAATWGGYKLPQTIYYTGGAVVTLYLTPAADQKVIIDDIWAGVADNTSAVASTKSGNRGFYTDTKTAGTPPPTAGQLANNTLEVGEVQKFEIPIGGMRGTNDGRIRRDQTLRLDIKVSAFTVEGAPVDIKVLYGSTQHPSRVSGPVNVLPAGVAAGNIAATYFLADRSFTQVAPTSATPQKRATESSLAVSGTAVPAGTLASASTWSWGNHTFTQPFKPTGDCLLRVFVANAEAQTVGALRGLRAILTFNAPGKAPISRQSDIGVGVAGRTFTTGAQNAPTARITFYVALNMTGIDVPAGTRMELQFITWSTSSDQTGKLYFFYGGTVDNAALMFILPPGSGTESGSGGGATASATSGATSPTTTATSGATSGTATSAATNATGSSGTAAGNGTNNGTGEGAGEAASNGRARAKDVSPPADIPGAGPALAVAALGLGLAFLRRRR
jgi:hypothetical protein